MPIFFGNSSLASATYAISTQAHTKTVLSTTWQMLLQLDRSNNGHVCDIATQNIQCPLFNHKPTLFFP
jgi:hypothetical protein